LTAPGNEELERGRSGEIGMLILPVPMSSGNHLSQKQRSTKLFRMIPIESWSIAKAFVSPYAFVRFSKFGCT
jgi:hypothetical protein